jgi:hypothetical protein
MNIDEYKFQWIRHECLYNEEEHQKKQVSD